MKPKATKQAKKNATKTAAKAPAKKNAKAKAESNFKKNDSVVFIGWDGPEPEYDDEDERIEEGMVGKVRSVSGEDLEVAFELGGDTTVVELRDSEVRAATAADIKKAAKMAEAAAAEDDDEDEDESDEEESDETAYEDMTTKELREECVARGLAKGGSKEDLIARLEENDADEGDEDESEEDEDESEEEETEPTLGELADEGDAKAIKALTEACKQAGINENDYETWVEVEAALAEDDEEEEGDEDESEDEDEDEETTVVDETRKQSAPREKSLGRKADEGDKAAVRELTKRAKAVGLDPDDADNGETWTAFEKTLKAAEKEASRPELKVTKSVTEEIAEDGDDAIAAAKRLVETAEKTYYTLGGVLAVIDRNKLHEKVKIKGEYPYQGQKGFETFCEEHLNVRYRKARYLINIYEAFTQAGLTEAKIGSIGWSKARELVAILEAEPEAAEKWVEKAKTSSTSEVAEAVKARLVKLGTKRHGNSKDQTARLVTCKFSVHEDEGKVVEEALALAKEQGDLKTDSEAFAYIVKEWMTFQS